MRTRDDQGRFVPTDPDTLIEDDEAAEAFLFLEHLPGVNFPFMFPNDRGLSFTDFCSDDDPADDLPVLRNAVVIA